MFWTFVEKVQIVRLLNGLTKDVELLVFTVDVLPHSENRLGKKETIIYVHSVP